MEPRVGNKFRLGRKIGSGSFGEIYLGSFFVSSSSSSSSSSSYVHHFFSINKFHFFFLFLLQVLIFKLMRRLQLSL
jgi:hypothetical protein